VESDSLARTFAANMLAKDDPESSAIELFDMMERTIAEDDLKKQEATKDFLVLVIQIISDFDTDYADEITKNYFDLTVERYMNI